MSFKFWYKLQYFYYPSLYHARRYSFRIRNARVHSRSYSFHIQSFFFCFRTYFMCEFFACLSSPYSPGFWVFGRLCLYFMIIFLIRSYSFVPPLKASFRYTYYNRHFSKLWFRCICHKSFLSLHELSIYFESFLKQKTFSLRKASVLCSSPLQIWIIWHLFLCHIAISQSTSKYLLYFLWFFMSIIFIFFPEVNMHSDHAILSVFSPICIPRESVYFV